MPERNRRLGAVVGLMLLATAVGYLCWLALTPQSAAGSPPGAPRAGGSTPSAPSSASSLSPVVEAPTPSPTSAVVPGPALPLEVVSASDALRARPGSCSTGGGALQRTTDGGRTWTTLTGPATSVVRILASSPSSFLVVGATKECTPRLYRTTDAGRTWAVSTSTANAWHPLPVPASGAVPTALHGPSGNVPLPCRRGTTLVALSGITLSDAMLACSDGAVLRTIDGGATWQPRTAVAGAGALSAVSRTEVWVASVQPVAGCAGVQVLHSTDGGLRWRAVGCAVGAQLGSVGLSFAGGSVGMLWDGTGVWTTGDGGSSWLRAGS